MIFGEIYRRIKIFVATYKFGVVIALGLLTAFLSILIFVCNNKSENFIYKPSNSYDIIDCNRAEYATIAIEKTKLLKDSNKYQLQHAQANGLKITYDDDKSFEKDVQRLVAEKYLIGIKGNPLYAVKEMNHSHPYVTPEMGDLLNEIAFRFRDKMKTKGIDYLLPIVTSALRTKESQLRLSRRNRNATEQSTHMFGTTVDITYKDFYNSKSKLYVQDVTARDVLTEVIIELREECRLVAVKERKQACFHFTVVNCAEHRIPTDQIKFSPLLIHK